VKRFEAKIRELTVGDDPDIVLAGISSRSRSTDSGRSEILHE
jgi:hypothetical protein